MAVKVPAHEARFASCQQHYHSETRSEMLNQIGVPKALIPQAALDKSDSYYICPVVAGDPNNKIVKGFGCVCWNAPRAIARTVLDLGFRIIVPVGVLICALWAAAAAMVVFLKLVFEKLNAPTLKKPDAPAQQ